MVLIKLKWETGMWHAGADSYGSIGATMTEPPKHTAVKAWNTDKKGVLDRWARCLSADEDS